MYVPPESPPTALVVESRERGGTRAGGAASAASSTCSPTAPSAPASTRWSLDDVRVVHLQLRDLAFCDSRGLRQLVAFVKAGRLAGRTVQIEEPSPLVGKLLPLFAAWALDRAVTPGTGTRC